jgi:predicted dehydrogenase
MSWAGNLLLTIGSPLRLAINKSTAARPASPLGTATVVSVGVLIIGIAMSSNPTRLRGELSVLVARAEVEIVCICAPSGLHAAIGEEVVRAGKHVVVEKPIATTLKAADQLIWSARASGVMLSVISQHRFDPGVVELKQLIQKGALGELLFGEASVKWFREASYYTGSRWRGTQEMGGGGALINQGIHYTDLLCWCMGPVAEVTALCDARAHEIEVEDIAVAMLRFRSGALGTVVASTSLYPGLPERLEVSGTAGSVIVENGVRVYEAVRGQGTLGGLSLGLRHK